MKIRRTKGISPKIAGYPQKTRGGRGGRAARGGRFRRGTRAAAQGLNAALGRGGAREETVTDVIKEGAAALVNRFRRNR